MKVAIYNVSYRDWPSNPRATYIAHAMRHGVSRIEGKKNVKVLEKFNGVEADVAIAYGWIHQLKDGIFQKYREAGKHFVFVDLGYWGRSQSGNYRLAVDSWDTAVNMKRGCDDKRMVAIKDKIRRDWNPNSRKIMIAAMSDKSAWTHDYRFLEWENRIKNRVNHIINEKDLDLEVEIREKPGKKGKAPPIEQVLKETRFVLTHHSNVAVDCIIAGIPFYSEIGVASHLNVNGFHDWSLMYPNFAVLQDRINLLQDISYAQWSVSEMVEGRAWEYVKEIICGLDS